MGLLSLPGRESCICGLALFTCLTFYFVQVPFVMGQTVEPNNAFFCSDTFCPEHIRQNPCTGSGASCNTTGFREFLDPDTCNCCGYCFDYLKENDTCSPKSLEKPKSMCGPHLECQIDAESPTAACKQMVNRPGDEKNFCLKKRNEYMNNKTGIVQFLPECDAHGDYAPRQCLPGSLCYCSNKKGEKIFGESLPTEHSDCACARDIDRLKGFGFEGTWPHCMPNGDYDELQCVIRSCYCRSYPTVVYNPQNMNKLKCFDPNLHIFDPASIRYYTRECEHRRAIRQIEILEAEVKGVLMIVQDLPECSPDGNFDKIQSRGSENYCSDQYGVQIENFHARKFTQEAEDMNCNCARARDMLKDSATGKPKCLQNGNYRPYQCVGSTCYCVDELGRQIIEVSPHELPDDQETKLPCYV